MKYLKVLNNKSIKTFKKTILPNFLLSFYHSSFKWKKIIINFVIFWKLMIFILSLWNGNKKNCRVYSIYFFTFD